MLTVVLTLDGERVELQIPRPSPMHNTLILDEPLEKGLFGDWKVRDSYTAKWERRSDGSTESTQ